MSTWLWGGNGGTEAAVVLSLVASQVDATSTTAFPCSLLGLSLAYAMSLGSIEPVPLDT